MWRSSFRYSVVTTYTISGTALKPQLVKSSSHLRTLVSATLPFVTAVSTDQVMGTHLYALTLV